MYSRAFMSGIQYIMDNNRKRKKANNSNKVGKRVSAAVAYATSQRSRAPREISSSPNSRRFSHRELVGTVNGSIAFTSTRYVCNPGYESTFPWLSSQAKGWEHYCFHSLCFEFVTRTATTTVGSVILSPDYDSRDLAPIDEKQATSYKDAVEDAPWKDQACHLTKAAMFPFGPRKAVRSWEMPGDLRTYDAASMYVSTVEMVGAGGVGKLWVSYDVELMVQQLAPSETPRSQESVLFTLHGGSQVIATGVPEDVAFDTEVSNGLRFAAPVAGVFTPPKGMYSVVAQCTFQDSVNEPFACDMVLQKNGVDLTYPVGSRDNREAIAGGRTSLSLVGTISCSGTDTIAINATLVGAAGALTALDEYCQILFQVV